mgnify:CR=1 FL=1
MLKYGTKQEQTERIGAFIDQARRIGLEKVEEWKITTDKFIDFQRKDKSFFHLLVRQIYLIFFLYSLYE